MNNFELKKMIKNSLGEVDKKFARHASDEKHASEIKKSIKKGEVNIDDALNFLVGILFFSGVPHEHIKHESDLAKKYWS